MQKRVAERVFISLGMTFVVAGGLISAVTASVPSQRTAWLVAYLVLIGGAAQIGGGEAVQTVPEGACVVLHRRPIVAGCVRRCATMRTEADENPSRRRVLGELLAFNLGNAAVIAGTFLVQPYLVDAGGAAIVVSLVLFWRGARGRPGQGWLRYTYAILVAALIVSIPIGLALAHVRAA